MKYGFIGCGNMGGAVARALSLSTKDIMLSDRSGKGAALAEELGIAYGTPLDVAKSCDRIFLAVKPFLMEGVLKPLQEVFGSRRPTLITMAAGLTLETIQGMAGSALPIIRMMPNTPTAIGKGVTQYCRNSLVEEAVLSDWLRDMAPCGIVDALDESLIDAASALSGSGPAYLYILIEALADGAVACGIPRAKAMEYAAATMVGAGEMYLATHTHPGALKDAVCSPKGSTIQGLRILEQRGFRSAATDCVIATYEKNKEIAKN